MKPPLIRAKVKGDIWRIRLTIWFAASVAGGSVAFFAVLSDLALRQFWDLIRPSIYISLFLTPCVGMLIVFLTTKFFPGAEGSGIPQVIAASKLIKSNENITCLVSIRIAIGKIVLGSLALIGGFSAGREGPSVQVSASILNSIHKFLPNAKLILQRDLILAGGAAGVAAAFNTPLAGIVFAIEELGKQIESKTSAILLTVIIVSGLTAQSLLGNYSYFGSIRIEGISASIAPLVLVVGILCGILGGCFSWILLIPQTGLFPKIWAFKAKKPVYFAGCCGVVVALIGIVTDGVSFGSGYSITAMAIDGEIQLPWFASLSRYFATVVSYFSGIPAGIFAPSLATGAAIGSNLLSFWGDSSQSGLLMALCMAAFLSAVTQAPITSAVIVMEIIDGHQMVISLMAATLIAKFISSQISSNLYGTLANSWTEKPSKMHLASARDSK